MNDLESMLQDIRWEVEVTRRYIGKDALSPRVMQAVAEVPRERFRPGGDAQPGLPQRPGAHRAWPDHLAAPTSSPLMTDLLEPDART